MASSDNSTNVSIPIPQYHVQKDLATSYLTEEVSDFFFVVTIFIFCVLHSDWRKKKLTSLCSIVLIVVSTIL